MMCFHRFWVKNDAFLKQPKNNLKTTSKQPQNNLKQPKTSNACFKTTFACFIYNKVKRKTAELLPSGFLLYTVNSSEDYWLRR